MKRKRLVILFCLLAFSLLLSSCCNGVYAEVGLKVRVYLQKEDGSPFTTTEIENFDYSASATVEGSFGDGTKKIKDRFKDSSIMIVYGIGRPKYDWKVKDIKKSYSKKLKDFWFKIEDPNGVYETYEMKPLDMNYEVVDESEPSIKYTIKLKKKVSSGK